MSIYLFKTRRQLWTPVDGLSKINIFLLILGVLLGIGGGYITESINQKSMIIKNVSTLLSNLKSKISALARARHHGGVSIERAKELIYTNPWLLILDVRTMMEFEHGHVPDAMNIPLSELQKRLGELNKTDEILVYCWAGQRSSLAVEILADNGFIGVYNLLGGIEAWVQGGHPTREGCECG